MWKLPILQVMTGKLTVSASPSRGSSMIIGASRAPPGPPLSARHAQLQTCACCFGLGTLQYLFRGVHCPLSTVHCPASTGHRFEKTPVWTRGLFFFFFFLDFIITDSEVNYSSSIQRVHWILCTLDSRLSTYRARRGSSLHSLLRPTARCTRPRLWVWLRVRPGQYLT